MLLATYWNTILFPVMVLTRKLLPSAASAATSGCIRRAVEALCRAATGIEHAWLGSGRRLPFGGSLIAVAAKQSM